MLIDLSLAEFADRAAAREPTPGGGAVAAYLGVLGAALGSMAGRFSEGRKDLREHADSLRQEIGALEGVRATLLDLVEADAVAYGAVSDAYKLPKGTPEEQQLRQSAIQAALRAALDPPVSACRTAVRGLEVLDGMRGHTNRNLISDVAVGAYALGAALRSAWINVLINLGGLDDAGLRQRLLQEGEALGQRGKALEEQIGTAIVDSLS